MKLILAMLLVGVVLVSGCTQTQNTPQNTTQTTEQSTQTSDQNTIQGKTLGQYTLSEVAQHNSASDCWMAINGKVYDMTDYISSNKHPGGEAILLGCGKDATSLFESKPTNNMPHSEKARNYAENFLIGVLK